MKSKNEAEVKEVLSGFMNCLVKKDSIKFYDLFIADPVAWVGIFKERSQKGKDNFFISNYKRFYRTISEEGFDEEKILQY